MLVEFTGVPQKGVYSKDYILALIAKYGVACGVGYVVEYRGQAIDALSHGRANDHLQYVHRVWFQDGNHESRPDHL